MPGSLCFPEGFKGGVVGKDFYVPINNKILTTVVPVTKDGRYVVTGKVSEDEIVATLFTAVCTPSGLTLENFSEHRVANPQKAYLTDDETHRVRVLVSADSGVLVKIIEARGWRR